jgi:hypothetical protein
VLTLEEPKDPHGMSSLELLQRAAVDPTYKEVAETAPECGG